MLVLHLLGTPSIHVDGVDLSHSLPRNQVRALFYRLAASPDALARADLAFLLWPDQPNTTALRYLSQRLSLLRRALPLPDLIQTTKNHIRLNADQVWCDLFHFLALCQESRRDQRPASLQEAAALYRGPFLDGFVLADRPEFEHWVWEQQRAWQRRYLDLLWEILDTHTEEGNLTDAIVAAQQYLSVDEVAEHVHRRLIYLFARKGERTAALRQYEQCVAVLERELGVTPLPETHAALQAALNHQPASRRHLDWQLHPALELPLTGRAEALAALEAAYGYASSGHSRFVFISGESGIGKTRLIQEFAHTLPPAAVLPLAGVSHRGVQTTPYFPVIQALRAHMETAARNSPPLTEPEQPGPLFPAGIRRAWLVEASRLLPELHTLFPSLPRRAERREEVDIAALHEALWRLLIGFAAPEQTIVLFLDDLHWIDRSSLDWLAYVAERIGSTRLLVVGCVRSAQEEILGDLWAILGRRRRFVRLALSEWSLAQVAQVTREAAALSAADAASLAERLYQAVGGNPFFVLATLNEVTQTDGVLSGDDRGEAGTPLPMPRLVQEMIERRLSELDGTGRQLLEGCAVLEHDFDLALLQETTGRGLAESVDGLEQMLRWHLLEARGTVFGFHHSLVREVVYAELSAWRRQLLHGRAAAALVTRHTAAPGEADAQIAAHFHRAGAYEQAVHYYRLAADYALDLYANREARAHLAQALAILTEMPPTAENTLQQQELLTLLGTTTLLVEGLGSPAAADYFDRAWQAAQASPPPVPLTPLLELAGMAANRNHLSHALELLEEGRAWLSDGHDEATRAELHYLTGLNQFLLGRQRAAHESLTRSIHHYKASPADATGLRREHREAPQAAPLIFLSENLAMLGYPDQALAALEEAIGLTQEGSHSHTLALCNRAFVYYYRGEYQQSARWAKRTIDQCRERDNIIFLPFAQVVSGVSEAILGEQAGEPSRSRRGLKRLGQVVTEETGHPHHVMFLAQAHAAAGDVEEAQRWLDRAMALSEANQQRLVDAVLYRLRGEWLHRQGAPPEQVAACFVTAQEIGASQEARLFELRAALSLARLRDAHGTGEERAAARARLAAVYGWFSEGFDLPDMQAARALLAAP